MHKYKLLISNTILSGGLFGLADVLIQCLNKYIEPSVAEKLEPIDNQEAIDNHSSTLHHSNIKLDLQKLAGSIDWKRTGSFFITGLAIGPLTHWWYAMLDRRFAAVTFRNVSKKLALDQFIGAPLFLVYFFIAIGYFDGEPFSFSLKELKNKFLTLYLADCIVMPAAQTINFVFVPPKYRVLYVYTILLAWDAFLSFMKHSTGIGKEMTDFVNRKFTFNKSNVEKNSSINKINIEKK